jgi:predicted NBD/HSP70 family sugar kinase
MVPRGNTKLVVASLGNDAGAIGAATMARRGGLTTAS